MRVSLKSSSVSMSLKSLFKLLVTLSPMMLSNTIVYIVKMTEGTLASLVIVSDKKDLL
jgi:hypothetical protein